MAQWPRVTIEHEQDYSFCFCCGKDNPIGLKLSFQWDGKEARAEFTPSEMHQGWQGIVHGGIIISLLDEAMTYAALFDGNVCVTAGLQARLKRPVPVNEALVVTASVVKKTRKLVTSRATLSSKTGGVVAEGTATQFIASPADGVLDSKIIGTK